MDLVEILKKVDHTLLTPTATFEEIKKISDEAIKWQVASICIPPSFVKSAKEYVKDKMKICTVVGFPNGYHETDVKIFETKKALQHGADEIDMVINLGYVKSGELGKQISEIQQIKKICGNKILKVIVETCLLTEQEKIKMCKLVTESGADFIKTSTGFSQKGATFEDISLFANNVGKSVQIKAAGGITSLQDAEKFIQLGANRLGSSKLIKFAEN